MLHYVMFRIVQTVLAHPSVLSLEGGGQVVRQGEADRVGVVAARNNVLPAAAAEVQAQAVIKVLLLGVGRGVTKST